MIYNPPQLRQATVMSEVLTCGPIVVVLCQISLNHHGYRVL